MLFATQSFLVAGLSRSGISAAEYLLAHGAKVSLFDDVEDEGVRAGAEELCRRGAHLLTKETLAEGSARCDILVLSPGIPIDHALALSFKRAGKRVLGESELGALALRCPVVAVTGTNGKTTTVSMLEAIFQGAGMNARACGNVGRPVTSCVSALGEEGVAVMEVSSFQLETLTSLRPHVAVVLNVTEDHLNRHYNVENYIFLKSRILKNSTESEYAVLNYDDLTVREFAQKSKAKAVWFSRREQVDGACLVDGYLTFRGERVMAERELSLTEPHNVENALAALAAAKLMGVSTQAISSALSSFKGVKHRIQTIGQVKGVTFVDDSKATNVDSAVKAIESVKGECVLLVGGKDKGYSYEPLFEAAARGGVAHAVLYGENAFKVLQSALKTGFSALTLCRPFDMAVRVAFLTARQGQTVLLSPASASFDEFHSYEERGERFAQLVEEFSREAGEEIASGD